MEVCKLHVLHDYHDSQSIDIPTWHFKDKMGRETKQEFFLVCIGTNHQSIIVLRVVICMPVLYQVCQDAGRTGICQGITSQVQKILLIM